MKKSLLVLMAMVSTMVNAESFGTIRPGLYAKDKNAQCGVIIDRIPGEKDMLMEIVSIRSDCTPRFEKLTCNDANCSTEFKSESGAEIQINISATERGILYLENTKTKKGQWKLSFRALFVELDSQCVSKSSGGSRE